MQETGEAISKVTPKQTPAGGKGRLQQRDRLDEEGKRAGPSKPPTHRGVGQPVSRQSFLHPEIRGLLRSNPPEDMGYRF